MNKNKNNLFFQQKGHEEKLILTVKDDNNTARYLLFSIFANNMIFLLPQLKT